MKTIESIYEEFNRELAYLLKKNEESLRGHFVKHQEANAHLIASAPKLLETLEKAVNDYGKPGGPWNVPGDAGTWINMAQEAIKKARGKS